MDPTETFLAFLNAICVNDCDGAYDDLESLIEWLDKDGFAPKFPGSQTPVPVGFVRNMHRILGNVI